MLPLQIVDSFLLDYNLGQALLFIFILALVGSLPLKSQKVVALTVTGFGLIFLLTPQSLTAPHYLYLGIALLVVGPMLLTTANR